MRRDEIFGDISEIHGIIILSVALRALDVVARARQDIKHVKKQAHPLRDIRRRATKVTLVISSWRMYM